MFDEIPLSTLDDDRVASLLVDHLIPKTYYPFLAPLLTPAHMSWSTNNFGSHHFIKELQTYLRQFTRICTFAISLRDQILTRAVSRDFTFPAPITWCELLILFNFQLCSSHYFLPPLRAPFRPSYKL